MSRIFLSIAIALLLTACGDEQAESKSGSSNFVPTNNQSASNQSQNNANNQSSNNVNPNNLGSLMERFGTEGPVDMTPKSPDGNAFCDLGSIRTDDLNEEYDTEVPPFPWESAPVADIPARCGDDAETAIWRLTNCERMARDLVPVECDLRLVWLGRAHSQDMIDRGFWSHTNPDNEDPFDRMEEAGIVSSRSGENLAQNGSAEGAHLGWMDSTGHRENILGGYSHVGTGFIENLYTSGFISHRK